MRLGVSKGVICEELNLAIRILTKWKESAEEGIPVVDVRMPPEELHDWLRNFYGELNIVSDKCASLAARLLESAE